MNKIFKKIWNKHRGCFVAVSEAMTSASQRAGKASVVAGIASLLFAVTSTNAATTINGDAELGNLKEWTKNTLTDSYIINGNATANVDDVYVSWTSKNYRDMENQTLTVNGNLTSTSSFFVIAHRGDGASTLSGALIVRDNLYLNGGLLRIGSGNTNSGGVVYTTFNVGGTLSIASGAAIDNRPDYYHVQLQMDAGTLDTSGSFDISSVESGNINYGNMIVRGGSYRQTNNVQTYVSNSLSLLGGTLSNVSGLVVGGKNGQFSVGNSLILGGGSLTQTGLLTQTAGSVAVTAGTYSFGTLNKSNGTLSNAGTLTLTNFNQSGGSASNTGNLTIGNANLYGTLSNTGTLNLTGTVTSRGNLSSSGTLNNKGSWTEANTYTISGNLNNTGSVNFQNGFTLDSNSRLTSSGTLQTNNAYNIFDSLGTTGQQDLHYVSLNSAVPQEIKTSLSDFFQKYVAGTVAQDLINHASFTGGKVIVTGVNLTQTQADDLTKVFKTKFFLS